jgi:hypothetical protein
MSLKIDKMNLKNGNLNRRKKDKTLMKLIKTIVKAKEDLEYLIKYIIS